MPQVPENLIAELKALLASRQAGERGEEVWYHCPFHDDEEASMHVHYGRGIWFCFACCPSGREATLWGLYEKLTGRPFAPSHPSPFPVTFSSLPELLQVFHRQLWEREELVQYLKTQRGLSEAVIRQFKLGVAFLNERWWLVIPLPDTTGEVTAVKLRRLNDTGTEFSSDRPKYLFATSSFHPLFPEKNNHAPFLFPLNFPLGNYVLVVGGELDALAAISAGYPAIAPTRGEGSLTSLKNYPELMELVVEGNTLVLILDNEPSVQASLPHIAELLHDRAFAVFYATPDLYQNAKDVTELVVQGRLQEVVSRCLPFTPPSSGEMGYIVYPKGMGYCYRQRTDRGWGAEERLTDFLFVPKMFIVDALKMEHLTDQEGFLGILCDIHLPNKAYLKDVVLPVSFFGDPGLHQKLASRLSLSPFIYTHKVTVWKALLKHLERLLPQYLGMRRVGLVKLNDTYAFIFPDIQIALSERFTGRVVSLPTGDNAKFHIAPERPSPELIAFWRGEGELPSEETKGLFPVIDTLLRVHEATTVWRLIAMSHAAPLTPFIREQISKMPVTFVFGPAGSGKTTLVSEVFLRLLGVSNILRIAATQTESTVRKYADIYTSIPLVFDEFTPDRHDPELLKNVKVFIHACYDGVVKQVSKSATELERPYYAHSPLWIIGENHRWMMGELALRERIYLIPVPNYPSEQNVQAFHQLQELRPLFPLYARFLYEFLIAHQGLWEEWWRQTEEVASQHLHLFNQVGIRPTERMFYMFCVALFGVSVALKFWRGLGYLQNIALSELAKVVFPFFIQLHPSNLLTEFLIDLDDLAANMEVEGVQFLADKGYLAIHLPTALRFLATKKPMKWQSYNSAYLKTYAANLKKSETESYIVEVEKVVKMQGKPQRALLVSPSIFLRLTGHPLEYLAPTLAAQGQESLMQEEREVRIDDLF